METKETIRTTSVRVDSDLLEIVRRFCAKKRVNGIEIKLKDFVNDAILAKLEAEQK